MATILQKPERSHKKKFSTVSVRSIRIDAHDDGEPVGRKQLRHLNTDLGKQRNGVEVIPKPSDDPRDPLNWPTYAKELTYFSVILSSGVVSILKTLFVSTNGVIATQFSVSYMAAAALTGVPFIFSSLSGIGAVIFTAVIGKRCLYLVGASLMLAGTLWNMHLENSYAQFMVSRIFQGIGWGITEALVESTIRDLFSVHERIARTNIHAFTTLLFTWGSPILGGYLSQSNGSFREEIMVLTILQAFSIFFLILLTPETSCFQTTPTITTATSHSPSTLRTYLTSLKPVSYRRQLSTRRALQSIRGLGAPTTILTFLLISPLIASTHALANSLSLLLSAMPTFLFPSQLGYLFIFPLIFSLSAFSLVSVVNWFSSQSARLRAATSSLTSVIPGVLLGISGLLSFGLYVSGELAPRKLEGGNIGSTLNVPGGGLNLKVVGVLFGMLVAAPVLLSGSASSQLPPFTGSASTENDTQFCLKNGYRFWQGIFTGIFITAMPAWIESLGIGAKMVTGLRDTTLALAVMQLILSSTVGALLWARSEDIKRVDAKVLGNSENVGVGGGRLELRQWESEESSFEA